MGARPNIIVTKGHKGHFTLSAGSSEAGYHEGCSFGQFFPSAVCDTDASKWPIALDTMGRFDELASICYDIRKAQAAEDPWDWTAFDDFFANLPTPTGTPFATSGEDFLSAVVAFDDNFTPPVNHRELILTAVLCAKLDGSA